MGGGGGGGGWVQNMNLIETSPQPLPRCLHSPQSATNSKEKGARTELYVKSARKNRAADPERVKRHVCSKYVFPLFFFQNVF